MAKKIKLKFKCPYPLRDDSSLEAVKGFGPTPSADDAGNGRCDNEEEWTATAIVIEEPTAELDVIPVAITEGGYCPECGNPGEALDVPNKMVVRLK